MTNGHSYDEKTFYAKPDCIDYQSNTLRANYFKEKVTLLMKYFCTFNKSNICITLYPGFDKQREE